MIRAFDPTTGLVAELYVAIDSTPPTASIPVPDGFVKGPLPVTATFDDGDGAGVTRIDARSVERRSARSRSTNRRDMVS